MNLILKRRGIFQNILESYKDSNDSKKIFNVDNRGDSLFVELIYSRYFQYFRTVSDVSINLSNLKSKLSFVAIKNGKHNGIGYLFSNFDLYGKNEISLECS